MGCSHDCDRIPSREHVRGVGAISHSQDTKGVSSAPRTEEESTEQGQASPGWGDSARWSVCFFPSPWVSLVPSLPAPHPCCSGIPPSLSPALALVASTHLLLLSLCLSSFLLSFLCLSSCVTLLFFPRTPHPQPCLQLPSPPQGLGSSKLRVTSTHAEQGRGCPWGSGWGCNCLDRPGI